MSLHQLANDLWAATGRVRFLGHWVPTRMLVIRLPNGALWVHSPIALDPEIVRDVASLGRVGHLIGSSKYHHLWLADWARHYPDTKVHGAPGLPEKRPAITFHEVLGDEAPADWRGVLDQIVFRGLPIFNEVIFLHRASRTLVVTDLVFNVYEAEGVLAPLVMRLDGMWKRFGPSRSLRLMMSRNRERAKEDLKRIQQWNYDRVIMAHGRVMEGGGREAMESAFAFLA